MGVWKESVLVKVSVIGFLILILLIPAGMVHSLITEREARSREVVDELSGKWGASQTLTGPVLAVPCREFYVAKDGVRREILSYVYILPDELKICGEIGANIRSRGIYDAVLYNANLEIQGVFSRPDTATLDIGEKLPDWSKVLVFFGITDLRGINTSLALQTGDSQSAMLEPGILPGTSGLSGVISRIDLTGKERFAVSVRADVNGSGTLQFVPVGKETDVNLSSDWPDPSFTGNFLPRQRTVDKSGFKAAWKVLHFNRNYPQIWRGGWCDVQGSEFGVTLFIPSDAYQQSSRTAKYAAMFISFTFMAFFISEVLKRVRIHPFQYLLVGLALIVFYSLLISLSEHIGFAGAYTVSALATTGLITAYAKSVMRKRSLALTVGAVLLTLYSYLYVLLQMKDYALVMGSAGLFLVLGLVMYLTRRIDWYSSGPKEPERR